LRVIEAKTLILTVIQEEELWVYDPKRRPLEISELSFKVSGVWAEGNPPRSGPKCVSSSGGTKARSHPHQSKTIFHPLQGPG
jgi:hypothetical protein